jgi:hypothetical protein
MYGTHLRYSFKSNHILCTKTDQQNGPFSRSILILVPCTPSTWQLSAQLAPLNCYYYCYYYYNWIIWMLVTNNKTHYIYNRLANSLENCIWSPYTLWQQLPHRPAAGKRLIYERTQGYGYMRNKNICTYGNTQCSKLWCYLPTIIIHIQWIKLLMKYKMELGR